MPHPHGHACRCPPPEPDDGLLRFTVDCDHYADLASALERIADKPAVTLRMLTSEPMASACDGSMTCPCERHASERAERVRHGVREARQPWQPGPSRRHRQAA